MSRTWGSTCCSQLRASCELLGDLKTVVCKGLQGVGEKGDSGSRLDPGQVRLYDTLVTILDPFSLPLLNFNLIRASQGWKQGLILIFKHLFMYRDLRLFSDFCIARTCLYNSG